jgi:4-hydroxyproline epimerase
LATRRLKNLNRGRPRYIVFIIVDKAMKTHTLPDRIEIIDSHTAGEPTRCVLTGGPPMGIGPLARRLERLRMEFDFYRQAILCEPRGSEVVVGAYLIPPLNPKAATGVIFFNNAGYLGMCGHGAIGVAATLLHMGKIGVGRHLFETPVGDVHVVLAANGEVTVQNVDVYRYRADVTVEVAGVGTVHGDVAWGGNWFFLVGNHPYKLELEHVEELTAFTWKIRQSLKTSGITGLDGAEIDHIELCTAAHEPANHGRNFVLCPGKAYDRSPCGTGTSAKMACLVADDKLRSGQIWRQEGILGSVFSGHIEREGDRIIPFITGSAYVTADSTLIFQQQDPFRAGIPSTLDTTK